MSSRIPATLIAVASLIIAAPVSAATFVYVSNAADGSLKPGERFKAASLVMPMAVSPDKRTLVAAVRSKPFSAYTYAIDPKSGRLAHRGTGPLAESLPYISFDRTGRFLFGASYGANLVSVNPVAPDGTVGDPLQVIPTARNAHSIRIDNTNRYVFA